MRKTRLAVIGGVVGVLAAVSACSSSSDSTDASSAPATSAEASAAASGEATTEGSAAPGGDAAAAAQAYLDQYSAAPSSIVLDTPLSKKPDTGKVLALLQTPQEISKIKYDATEEAAKLLGWEVKRVPLDGTAEGTQKAFQQALDQGVDGIAIGGDPRSIYEVQLKAAADAGIPVVQDSTNDQPGDGITAVIDGANQVKEWGRMNAAWIAVDSGGTGNVLSFNLKEYPILGVWQEGLNEGLAEFCPGCTIQNIDVSVNDMIGGKVPNLVASEFRRNPDAKYGMFAIGGLTVGVPAALQALDITDVKLGGESPDPANIQALSDGTEVVWTGFPTKVLGYRIADAFARAFNGEDVAVATDTFLPTQLLTAENIGAAPLEDLNYVGYPDYATEFAKLWGVQS